MNSSFGTKLFSGFAVALLVCTGLGKVIAYLKPVPEYVRPDPIFAFLTMGQVLLLGGACELVLASSILAMRSEERKAVLIAWFGATVLLYRSGFKLLGVAMPCHCLGYFARWSPLSPSATDSLMLASALFLLGGGVALLLSPWVRTYLSPQQHG